MNLKKKSLQIPLIIFISLIFITFAPFIFKGKLVYADDLRLEWTNLIHQELPRGFIGNWSNNTLFGAGKITSFNIQNIFYWLFPPIIAIHLLYIFILSLTLFSAYFFCKSHFFQKIPSIVVSFLFTFSPMYFTYIRTGHIGKMFSICFFFLAFGTLRYYFMSKKNHLPNALLTTLFLSFAFISEAVQTSLYFVIMLVCYIPFLIIEKKEKNFLSFQLFFSKMKKKLLLFLLIPFFSIFFAYQSIEHYAYVFVKKDYSKIIPFEKKTTNQQSSKQKWDWATQWSLAPIETIEFFAPGIFGYYTGSKENPYWGKTGQSPNWEKHQRGFYNYSYTSNYLGVICFIFFIYALFITPRKIKLFWGGAVIISLLLSYGRFFPLYQFFYHIPFMDEFRNPNKFLHLFHFSIFTLSAYSINHFYITIKNILEKKDLDLSKKKYPPFQLILITIFIVSILSFIIFAFNSNKFENHLSNLIGFKLSHLVITNIFKQSFRFFMIYSLAIFPLFYLIYLMKKNQLTLKTAKLIFIYFLVFSFFDFYLINRKYILFIDAKKNIQKDKLIDFLLEEKQKKPFRTKVITQKQYLKHFIWTLSPYYSIDLIDYRAIRKWPDDIKTYFKKMNNYQTLNHLKLANVRYILFQQPIFHNELNFKKQYSFEVIQESVFLYELKNYSPRVYLANHYSVISNKEAFFTHLNSSNFNFSNEAIFFKQPSFLNTNQITLPVLSSFNIKSFSDNQYHLEVSNAKDNILVLANKYNNHWKAYANGKKLAHFPVNYFFNGFYLNEDTKKITILYQPNRIGFFITLLNYLVFASIFIWFVIDKKRKYFES